MRKLNIELLKKWLIENERDLAWVCANTRPKMSYPLLQKLIYDKYPYQVKIDTRLGLCRLLKLKEDRLFPEIRPKRRNTA